MYLHLGGETVIRTGDIIGIFDIENTSVSRLTREFLASAEKGLLVTSVTQELPKSFVVTQNKEGSRIYISQISAQTLKKRTAFIERL